MAEENKVVETEAKEVSKTEKFKEHIQKIIWQTTGKKVSKSVAWELYKNIYHGSVEFVLNDADHKVPLAGVCTLEILETKPRGSKAGLDKDGNPIEGAEVWEVVPRMRVNSSSVVNKYVEWKYGLGNHTDVEEKHYGIFKSDEETEAEFKAKAEKKAEKKADAPADDTEAKVDEALVGLDEI